MKGLALVLSKGKPPMAEEEEDYEGEEAPPSSKGGGGSSKQFAKLAAEALADGDVDTAADALVSLVRSCK